MLKPIIQMGFNRLEAETRNTLILSIEKWAEQTVHEVEHALINYDNPTKKDLAVKLLTERIRKNKIVGYFPPEVISGYIEEAVRAMKKGN
ncbi:MAG: hypothetical protein LBI13_07510 [Streptococcaceae bacterium]|jgi:hypothetical protein|nr:hypothetical protein [Streptococcaceae bacterium]